MNSQLIALSKDYIERGYEFQKSRIEQFYRACTRVTSDFFDYEDNHHFRAAIGAYASILNKPAHIALVRLYRDSSESACTIVNKAGEGIMNVLTETDDNGIARYSYMDVFVKNGLTMTDAEMMGVLCNYKNPAAAEVLIKDFCGHLSVAINNYLADTSLPANERMFFNLIINHADRFFDLECTVPNRGLYGVSNYREIHTMLAATLGLDDFVELIGLPPLEDVIAGTAKAAAPCVKKVKQQLIETSGSDESYEDYSIVLNCLAERYSQHRSGHELILKTYSGNLSQNLKTLAPNVGVLEMGRYLHSTQAKPSSSNGVKIVEAKAAYAVLLAGAVAHSLQKAIINRGAVAINLAA